EEGCSSCWAPSGSCQSTTLPSVQPRNGPLSMRRKDVAGLPPSVVAVGFGRARPGWPMMSWTSFVAVDAMGAAPFSGWHGSWKTVGDRWNDMLLPVLAGPSQVAYSPAMVAAQPTGATKETVSGNGSWVA